MAATDELAASFRDGARRFKAPTVESIHSLREARERRVKTTRFGVALAVVGVTVVVFLIARSTVGTPHAQPAGVPFDPTAYGTYVFSDIDLVQARPDQVGSDEDPSRTFFIDYRSAWSGDGYPGEHTCRWSVLDEAGKELGASDGTFATMETPVTWNHPGSQVTIDGDPAAAASARITCDPARLDTPVAYAISGVQVVSNPVSGSNEPSRPTVEFHVAWPVEPPAYPGVNNCAITVMSASGEVVARSLFTLSVGVGAVDRSLDLRSLTNQARAAHPETLQADVSCEPYTGLRP